MTVYRKTAQHERFAVCTSEQSLIQISSPITHPRRKLIALLTRSFLNRFEHCQLKINIIGKMLLNKSRQLADLSSRRVSRAMLKVRGQFFTRLRIGLDMLQQKTPR